MTKCRASFSFSAHPNSIWHFRTARILRAGASRDYRTWDDKDAIALLYLAHPIVVSREPSGKQQSLSLTLPVYAGRG
jgi:hypothetical protein